MEVRLKVRVKGGCEGKGEGEGEGRERDNGTDMSPTKIHAGGILDSSSTKSFMTAK